MPAYSKVTLQSPIYRVWWQQQCNDSGRIACGGSGSVTTVEGGELSRIQYSCHCLLMGSAHGPQCNGHLVFKPRASKNHRVADKHTSNWYFVRGRWNQLEIVNLRPASIRDGVNPSVAYFS